jgi:hypothetical protein
VRPVQFDSAVVTGMSYMMTGGGGIPTTQKFKFSKSPETGQIYLDTWGTIVSTKGWPQQRPMAGQKGEIMDFVTPFAAIRWTRKEGSEAVAFGQVQQQQMHATTGGAAEVANLAQLRDQGLLSENEFQEAKKKALGI